MQVSLRGLILFCAILLGPFVFTFPSQAASETCPLCPVYSEDPKPASDFSDKPAIGNASEAAANYNHFKFRRRNDDVALGYTKIRYSFVDKDLLAFKDSPARVKTFLDRSLWAWVKSIFISTNQTFLVTLDAYRDSANSQLVATKPLFYVTENESFASLEDLDSLALEGELGFPVKSDEPIYVKLTIRHTNSTSVTLQNAKDLFNIAAQLATVAGGISSLVELPTWVSYNEKLKTAESLLAKFSVSKELSRTAMFRHKKGDLVGFVYDFKAPGVDYGRFKLDVSGEYLTSLLADKSTTVNSQNVLAKKIYFKDNFDSLRNFIEGHDISKPAINSLSSEKPNISDVCGDIMNALSERLVAADAALALNSYIDRNIGPFKKNWDPDCFRPEDRKVLKEYKVDLALPDNAAPGAKAKAKEPQEVPISVLEPVIQNIGVIIQSKHDSEVKQAASLALKDRQGSSRIQFIDSVPLVLAAAEKEDVSMSTLVQFLRNLAASRTLLCYVGTNLYDKDGDKNNIGTLTTVGNKTVEVRFKFEPAPENADKPKLVELELSLPSADTLKVYRQSFPSGCNGFTPWEEKTVMAPTP